MTPEEPTAAERIVATATGYCELGMYREAWDELETLEPEDRALPEVLRFRLGLLSCLNAGNPRPSSLKV